MPNKTKQNTKNSTEQICSQPLYKSQTTHHTQPTPKRKPLRPAMRATTTQQQGSRRSHGVEREPDSVLIHHNVYAQPNTHPHPPPHTQGSKHMRAQENKPPHPPQQADTMTVPHKTGLPRKEVIQPHLPVRLPCYDFVPIANPTFDHSPRTNRLGHGLRVLPTFVT